MHRGPDATIHRAPGLDLLRAAAIGWVMLYHLESYGVRLPGVVHHGWMGVDLFFVLSGYLIGWQLLKPYACGEQPRWGQFMLRRGFRVLPAYLVVLALYFTVPAVREADGIAPPWQFLTFTANLFPDYFHHTAYSHAWSLCVEEHFYLLLPAIAWLLARKPTSGNIALSAMTVLVGGMLLRGWLWQHEVAPYAHLRSGENNFFLRYVEVIYIPTWNRLDGLLAGVMLAVVKAFRPQWWARAMSWGPAFLVLGVAGIFACMRVEAVSYFGAVALFPLLSISLACLVVAVLSPRTWPGRVAVPGACYLAAISFSLYLTHKQVYSWIHDSVGPHLPGSALLAFCLYNAAALVVATVLYQAVERPCLRLRDRLLATTARPGKPMPATAP
ncbi:MAG: acyltransferase family protein [Massilia sp.]